MTTQTSNKQTPWLEIVAAIVLSLASLLTAWNGYQAARWSRTMAVTVGTVVAKLFESTRLSTRGGQDTLIDVVIFTNWLEAASVKNDQLADFYRSRFREEFKPAFDAWVALDPINNPGAPASPFAMPDYAPARLQEANRLQAEAVDLQQDVRNASENVAHYIQNTLYLASSLFFVGISRMFPHKMVRSVLQGVAILLLLAGVWNIVTGPIA